MRLGTINITHAITCKCGAAVIAGTARMLYAKFFLHCWARHEVSTRELASGLWALLMRGAP